MSVHHAVVSSRSKSVVESSKAEDVMSSPSSRRRATFVCSGQQTSASSQGSAGSLQEQTPSTSGVQQEAKPSIVSGKVLLLGDSGVGKTCLLVRFRDGRFLYGSYISTVGVDFRSKVVTVDEAKVKLQIWDTAGQERFRSVTHAYYRDAHALLLLYDVTNKTSFDNIRAWLGEIREYAQDDVVIMLLGNKSDCGSEREVRREDGERLAREYNVIFLETSAKTGLNVELAFSAVARELLARSSAAEAAGNGAHDGGVQDSPFSVQDYIRENSQRIGATSSSTCAQCST